MNQHFTIFRNFSRFLMGLFLVFSVAILRGQTIYIGADNGDWATVSNWSNNLPAVGNDATVPTGKIVCINSTTSIGYMVQNYGTIINKATTTVSGSLLSGGALENAAGATLTFAANATVQSSGGFTNKGTLDNRTSLNSNSPLTNTATGVINNYGMFMQLATATNNGTVVNFAGTFLCPSTFTNNKTVDNRSAATWKVDFGGTFTNAAGSNLVNAGTFQNFSNFTNGTTVANTGTFQNYGTHTCNGVFNNENNARFETTATVNLAGTWNNKLGATTQNGFKFIVLANAKVANFGTFQNNDQIDIRANGVFCNEAAGQVISNFGSSILNAGLLWQKTATSKITTNGSITNSKKIDNNGEMDFTVGAQLINNDSLINKGLIKSISLINNTDYWSNAGTVEINSGGVMNNTGRFVNELGAKLFNSYEIYNKTGANFTNFGLVNNYIRFVNEGTVVTNSYFTTSGDVLNKTGATFRNTEIFEIKLGAFTNEGSLTNTRRFINGLCGTLANRASGQITNNRLIENSGLVFQYGTITGNAITPISGYIHTNSTNANAPICLTTVNSGTDAGGQAKVYAQSVMRTDLNIDTCFGYQYFFEGVNRKVYTCSQIGQTLTGRFKLLARTGDSLTCNVNVRVFDGVAPFINNCPKDRTVYSNSDSIAVRWTAVTATDNCGGNVSFTATRASGSRFGAGTTEVVISARDSVGNTNDCIFKVKVVRIFSSDTCATGDTTKPVFVNCPTNRTINAIGGAVVAWNEPTVTDNCYPISVTNNFPSGTFFPAGTHTVTYTATDSRNNTATCNFTITVNGGANICANDVAKPVFKTCPSSIFLNTNTNINGAVALWATPSVSDNCSAVTLTSTHNSGSVFQEGTTTVTYTARDTSNNSSTCSFNITVAATNPCAGDVTAPTLTCPANVVVTTNNTSATATWTVPVANDACTPVSLNATHTPNSVFPLDTTTVTYTASDKIGNTRSCSFKVIVNNPCVNDRTAPVIAGCPADITINATNSLNGIATWTAPTATDNCGTVQLTSNFSSGSAFRIGVTEVVYTAIDLRGNVTTCKFNVTVNRIAVLTCDGNVIANNSFERDFTDWYVSDIATTSIINMPFSGAKAARLNGQNKPILSRQVVLVGGTYNTQIRTRLSDSTTTGNVGIEFYNASGAVITTARITRAITSVTYQNLSFTFVKPANATSFSYFIEKTSATGAIFADDICVTNPCTNDITKPTITACPANIVRDLTGTATSTTVTWTAPTITDNCSTPSIVSNFTSGQSFGLGTTIVKYVATDAAGNKDSCQFNIIVRNACVNETIAPTFTSCPQNITLTSTNGLCVAANFATPTATDNCGTPSVSGTHARDFCFPIGTTNVVYTAVDGSNNQATCRFSVTVNQPIIRCAAQGLVASYFNNTDLSGTPVLQRIEPTINNTWYETAPNVTGIGADNFSVRWEGTIEAPVTGTYTFKTTTDDAVKLWIGGNLIIDKWIAQPPTSWTGTIDLVAGQRYTIKMDYNEYYGWAVAQLFWSYTGQAEQIVPQNRLCAGGRISPCLTAPSVGGTISARAEAICASTSNLPAGFFTLSGHVGTVQQWEWSTNGTTWNVWYSANAATNTNPSGYMNTATTFYTRALVKNGVCDAVYSTVKSIQVSGATVGGTVSPASQTISSLANGVVPTRHTLVGQTGTVVRWEFLRPNSTTWENWGGSGSTTAPNNCCFLAVGTWKVRAIVKNGACGEVASSEANIIVTDACTNAPSIGGTVSPASQTILSTGNGTVPTRHTLSGQSGDILRWEYKMPNTTNWVNWGGGGSATAPSNCCFWAVGTWKVRAIIKRGSCAEVASSEASIIVTSNPFDATKCYKIVAVHSGKALGVKNNTNNNGDEIVQRTYTDIAANKWKIECTSDGYFILKSVANPSKAFDVRNAQTTDGGIVQQWDYYGGTNQQWTLEKQSDGSYKIAARHSSKVLDVYYASNNDNTQIYTYGWHGGGNQRFFIEEVSCTTPPSVCTVNGSILVERWNTMTWNFPIQLPTTAPTTTTYLTNTCGPWHIADNYTSRVRGYIKPQQTGTYYFNVTGDDITEFFLSTNSSAANMTRRAYVNGWTTQNETEKYPSQTSTAVTLTAGQTYYFELRQIEGGGGDGWNIFWKTPTNQTWQIIPSQFLARPCDNSFQGLTQDASFSFDARAEGKNAVLDWTTNVAEQHDYYIVEKMQSATGMFEALETVNANTKTGNVRSFNYTDTKTVEGENTYRIVTVLNNGTQRTSEPKTVEFGKNADFTLYPNPADDFVSVDLGKIQNKSISITVIDLSGKIVLNNTIEAMNTASIIQLDVSQLQTGTYLMHIQVEGKRQMTKQFKIAK